MDAASSEVFVDGMPTQEDFKRLVERANAGEQQSLAELRRVLDENPIIWQRLGDLGAHARLALIKSMSGEDRLLFESISRSCDELEAKLRSLGASKLEALAVQRVVMCWLEIHWVETRQASREAGTLPQSHFQLRLKDSAARRYDMAVRSLLLVQKLMGATSEDAKPRIAKIAG